MIGGTVSVFLLFTKLCFHSKWINALANSAFSVFLIHGDFNTMDYLFNDLLNVRTVYSSDFWPILFLFYMAAIYIVCAMIDMGKKRLLDKPINCVFDHIAILNYKITTEEN